MEDFDEEAQEEALSEDVAHIAQVLADSLPDPRFKQAPSNPFTTSAFDPNLVNFEPLVHLRRAHQTKQAESGTRRFLQRQPPKNDLNGSSTLEPAQQAAAEKQQVHEALAAILKHHTEVGVGTGLERAVRWKGGKNSEADSSEKPTAGNSANAAVVASANARSVRDFPPATTTSSVFS